MMISSTSIHHAKQVDVSRRQHLGPNAFLATTFRVTMQDGSVVEFCTYSDGPMEIKDDQETEVIPA